MCVGRSISGLSDGCVVGGVGSLLWLRATDADVVSNRLLLSILGDLKKRRYGMGDEV